MQYLRIYETTKFKDLVVLLGQPYAEQIITCNGLPRVPDIGKSLAQKCLMAILNGDPVSWESKTCILNKYVQNRECFETAALLDEDGWKILFHCSTFPEHLLIPDNIRPLKSRDVLGDDVPVSDEIYKKVMAALRNPPHQIDPALFADYFSSAIYQLGNALGANSGTRDLFQWFHIPWGEVTLYSSLDGSHVEFPVYPESLTDSYKANYSDMPSMLYQYEPWKVYESSGPRSIPFKFHMHRHMWTGDHMDGKANELIRFCEAFCYPQFKGSSVVTSTATMYIGGSPIISGILQDVSVDWGGPIADDGWYLDFTLNFTITEISKSPLNYTSIRNKSLIE